MTESEERRAYARVSSNAQRHFDAWENEGSPNTFVQYWQKATGRDTRERIPPMVMRWIIEHGV